MVDTQVGTTPPALVQLSRLGAQLAAPLAAPLVPLARAVLQPPVDAVRRALLDLAPGVLNAVLDRVDLTQLVIERVDIDEVVKHVDLDAAAEQIDIQAILDRVDLIGLAGFIIDGVDLPQIIRDSTGSMASEGVRGVRVQTMDADERVGRLVDRVLLRRHDRQVDTTVTGLVPEQRTDQVVEPSRNGDGAP